MWEVESLSLLYNLHFFIATLSPFPTFSGCTYYITDHSQKYLSFSVSSKCTLVLSIWLFLDIVHVDFHPKAV
jgi:hypothetical protein